MEFFVIDRNIWFQWMRSQGLGRGKRNIIWSWRWLPALIGVVLWLWGTGWSVVWAQQEPPSDPAAAQSGGTTATADPAVTADTVQVRRVKVNFFINSVHTIDDAAGSYVIDFWFDLFWRDPTLEGKSVADVDPARLWNPQIQMLNSNNLTVLYESHTDSFEPETNVHRSQRLVGTFTTPFDLTRFPFDRQTLMMVVESSEFDSNRLLFDFLGADQTVIYSEKPFTFPLPLGKYISPEFTLRAWSLTTANVVQQIHVLPYDKSSWAQFRVELTVERQSRTYVLKIMLVFGLIMVLGATTFAIALRELRYRLLVLFLLLLTAVTFDFTRLQNSPRTAYLTLLDQQALLCYFVIALAVGAVVLIALQNRRDTAKRAQQVNRWATLGYCLLVALIHLGLGWYAIGG